ncbi:MAG: VanZ family protein [Aristaeellaceae bacterium]
MLETRIKLIPFAGETTYGIHQTIIGMEENAIMFFPLGGLLLSMFLRMKPWQAIAIGAGASIFIELVQLITHRGITATEDLVANTIGCALGVVVTLLLRRLVKHA